MLPLYILQNLLVRDSKNGTVLDLIIICKKKGTIKYSNKTDKFFQMAELCEFEVWPFSSVGKLKFCISLFAIKDKVTGEKSSSLKGNYSRKRRLPKYGITTSFVLFLQLQDFLNPSRAPKK